MSLRLTCPTVSQKINILKYVRVQQLQPKVTFHDRQKTEDMKD